MAVLLYRAEDVIGDRFLVLRRIDTRGRGNVYAVKEIESERVLAIKVVDREDDLGRKRLRAEFDTLRALEHPNIVKVHEWGEDGEACFYTMDRIEGTPLLRFVESNLMLVRESIGLFKQVIYAVAWLHERGVVHRDLKPDNILVDASGVVTLVDFGICRSPQRPEITATGDMTGTLQWMSPEQAAASLGDKSLRMRSMAASPLVDVYALGIMLYHLLSGKWPHGEQGEAPAEHLEFLRRVATERPAMAEFADAALGHVAMGMLLPPNEGRPNNALAVLRTFEAATAGLERNTVFSPLCDSLIEQIAEAARRDEESLQSAREREPKSWQGFGMLGAAGLAGTLVMLLVVGARGTAEKAPDLATRTTNELIARGGAPAEGFVDRGPGGLIWAPPPFFPPAMTEGIFDAGVQLPRILLQAKLITGPLPGQKRYPCNGYLHEFPWKGGYWREFVLEGREAKDRIKGCKSPKVYEPDPGYCERTGGFIYAPVWETEGVKPPTNAVTPDPTSEGPFVDPNGLPK